MNIAWKRFFWWWWRNNTWKKCIKRDGIKESAFFAWWKREREREKETKRKREKTLSEREREREGEWGIKRWEDAQEKEEEDAKGMFRMFKKGFSSVIPFTFFLPLLSFFLPSPFSLLLSPELHKKKKVLELGGEENIWHEKNSTLFWERVTVWQQKNLFFSLSPFSFFSLLPLSQDLLYFPHPHLLTWSFDPTLKNTTSFIILIHNFLKNAIKRQPLHISNGATCDKLT